MNRADSNEEGQVTLLALGLCIVTIAVAGLAVDGARVWLYKRTLQATVDAAAASGASGLDVASLYAGGALSAQLDPDEARRRAASLISRRGLAGTVQVATEAGRVRVALHSKIETSFLSLVGIGHLPVTAEAVAQPFFGRP